MGLIYPFSASSSSSIGAGVNTPAVAHYVTPQRTANQLFELKSDAQPLPELEVTPLFVLLRVNSTAHQSARL